MTSGRRGSGCRGTGVVPKYRTAVRNLPRAPIPLYEAVSGGPGPTSGGGGWVGRKLALGHQAVPESRVRLLR